MVVWLIVIVAPVWVAAMTYLMWVRLGGTGSGRIRDHAVRVRFIDRSDTVLRVSVVIWLGATAIVSLVGDGPFKTSWLASKVLLFSLLVTSSLGWKWLGKAIGQARVRLVSAEAGPTVVMRGSLASASACWSHIGRSWW